MEMPPIDNHKQAKPQHQHPDAQIPNAEIPQPSGDIILTKAPAWYQTTVEKIKRWGTALKPAVQSTELKQGADFNFDNWVKYVFDYLRNLSLCVGLGLLGPYINANQIDLHIEGLATVVGQSLPWIALLLSIINSIHLASKLIYTGDSGLRKIASFGFWGSLIIINILLFSSAAQQQSELLKPPASTNAPVVDQPSTIPAEQGKP